MEQQSGKVDGFAIYVYSKTLHLGPFNVEAYYNRGLAQFNLGQYKAAIADYDEALHLKPDYAIAYCNRGLAKRQLGRIGKARKDLRMVLDLARETGNEKLIKLVKLATK